MPLRISGPLVLAGVTRSGPVSNTDLAPTMLDLARREQPARSSHGRPTASRSGRGPSQRDQRAGARGPDRGPRQRGPLQARLQGTSYVGVRPSATSYIEHHRGSAPRRPAAIGLPIGAGRTIRRRALRPRVATLRAREPGRRSLATGRCARALVRARALARALLGAECVDHATVPGRPGRRDGPPLPGGGADRRARVWPWRRGCWRRGRRPADPRSEPAAGSSRQPNIVLITTDDQTAASILRCAGVEQLISAQGMTFTSMVASSRSAVRAGDLDHRPVRAQQRRPRQHRPQRRRLQSLAMPARSCPCG